MERGFARPGADLGADLGADFIFERRGIPGGLVLGALSDVGYFDLLLDDLPGALRTLKTVGLSGWRMGVVF